MRPLVPAREEKRKKYLSVCSELRHSFRAADEVQLSHRTDSSHFVLTEEVSAAPTTHSVHYVPEEGLHRSDKGLFHVN